jgi:hypothetical protein
MKVWVFHIKIWPVFTPFFYSQLPSENWFDLLEFVPRSQLAKIVPKIGNRQFATIIQTFLHEYGQFTLDKIKIIRPYDEHPSDNGCPRVRVWQKQMHRFVRVKLADAQVPKNIANFKLIKLRFAALFKQTKLTCKISMFISDISTLRSSIFCANSNKIPCWRMSIYSWTNCRNFWQIFYL